MHPILIDLGFYALPSYGVLLASGVLLAMWNLRLRAQRAGLPPDRVVDFSLWILIWALIGAKVLLILVEFPRYFAHPRELLGVVRAGGVFLGGFVAAVIAAFILIRKYALPTLRTFDVITPSVSLAHAVGRIACLMAGCCWGGACERPWAMTYTDPKAAELLGTPLHQHLHPFPVYAAVFNFCLFLGLAYLFRLGLKPGRVFATYLTVYGAGRFLLEYTRGDVHRGFVFGGQLSTSQLIGALMVLSGIAIHIWIQRRKTS